MSRKQSQRSGTVLWRAAGLIGFFGIALANSAELTAEAAGPHVEPWPETLQREIESEFETLAGQLAAWKENAARREVLVEQTFRPEALPTDTDRDPVDMVLRRTAALLGELRCLPTETDLATLNARWQALQGRNVRTVVDDHDSRRALFADVARLRRTIAFSNPLLDFDRIVFLKRHALPGIESRGNHMCQ